MAFSRVPKLTESNYNSWKVKAFAYLCACDDEMCDIISDGPIRIFKVITRATGATEATPDGYVEKPKHEWSADERRRANLDNVGRNALYTAIGDNDNLFNKVKSCKTTKEIWDKLATICEGSTKIKENKLSIAMQRFENFKMMPNETLDQLDARFTSLITELASLDKELTNKEMVKKIFRSLPSKYLIKTVAMRESQMLDIITPEHLFSELRAFEFELGEVNDTSFSVTESGALITTTKNKGKSVSEVEATESDEDQEMDLLVKKFKKFLRHEKRNPASHF